jgi:uncharacterized repeat protein (TIGR01451 family)
MLLFFVVANYSGYSQIVLVPGNNSATCNLGSYGAVTISVPKEVLTGDNIPLNITLPGTLPSTCTKSVKITRSSNLDFQSSGGIAFVPVAGDPMSHENSTALPGNDGQNFNVFFKFPAFVTCNNTVGTFNVTVTADCGGVRTTCTTSVTIKARADNYWTISKHFHTGDLTCGISKWYIRVKHNNPNGAGLGTYNLTGTITETATVPVVSGSSFNINYSGAYNGSYVNFVTLQNCGPSGSTITNTANYNFSLGGGCQTMTGTVSATSPPLASPNASISFVKSVSNPANTNLTPGCYGQYYINTCNNGNVPWTNLVITDNFNIPGITVNNINLPTGWTSSPVIPGSPPAGFFNQSFTFTAPSGFVLNPGDCVGINVKFTIDSSTPVGTTIANTATLNYQASTGGGGPGNGGSGNGPSPCPSISCPTINAAVQNTTSNVSFVVEAPKPIVNIKKCILNPPNTLVPPIYQIGNIIEYSIMISNSGAGSLSTTVSDAIGSLGQNLQLIPGSITYNYYDDEYLGKIYGCNPNFSSSSPITSPFTVTNTSTTSPLTWNITNMPGTCDFGKANFLVITFKAKILPQLSGTKTNTATVALGPKSSSVNYTIDQVGILAINKKADVEFVDNGGTFNYILTVSNNGSVPLDNIVVSDALPSCVTRNGPIIVKNGLGSSISSTATANVNITLSPTQQIMPGESFVITIPVKKTGGGNCCNISASVTAKMTTTGIALNANHGDSAAPAACVKSSSCCDIEEFEASIEESNGAYNVIINGGSIPIQEVEIAMVDYHIEYSNIDCKPSDLGVFGTLSTTSNLLGNLVLNPGDNNTSSLTWLPGSPSILNTSVNLNIVNPLVLNLDCCDVSFYFCLKVRVKDANCNVCEKIICFSSDNINDNPCDLVISNRPLEKKYCSGTIIPISWSGVSSSGFVNLYLYDNTNSSVYQVIATNLPDTGSYNFTVPLNIPCTPPRTWSFIIEDTKNKCLTKSNTFIIECCGIATDFCECGTWTSDTVSIKGNQKDVPIDSQLKTNLTNTKGDLGQNVKCGNEIQLISFYPYSFTAPDFICSSTNCKVTYSWSVETAGLSIQSGIGKTFSYSFLNSGNYKIIFTPNCGGKRCEPCEIFVNIPKNGNNNGDDILKN